MVKKAAAKEEEKLEFLCRECGTPCRTMYCSKLCKNRWWKKSATFKKNKCQVCGEPCNNIFCSKKCMGTTMIKEHKAICEFCGEEFIYHKEGYKKRGQMRFCSSKCKKSIYRINENYFFEDKNIPKIYQTLGFIFASGIISDIKLGIIDIIAEKEPLERFAKTIGSTFKINKTDGQELRRTYIRSNKLTDYLFSIGFSSAKETHEFPLILPEYKLDFIKGYAAVNSELHQNDEVMFITTKSYSLARGIAESLNCELVTKQLGFICVIRNPKLVIS